MNARSFSHTGITVSNFNRAVRFYWDVFGCPLVGVTDAPPDRVRGFFGVDVPGATCRIGWIRIPGGAVIEIFHFEPQQPPQPVVWSRLGMTHICLNVRGIRKWHEYLIGKGLEIVSPGFTAADEGKNDASTTKRLEMSCARQNGSSTDRRESVPKQSVPHWCVVLRLPCECVTTIQNPRRRRILAVSFTSVRCGARLLGQ